MRYHDRANAHREGEALPFKPAKKPISNWDDLRFLLAVSRGQTLAAAAKLLVLDNTTVSRRIGALQIAVGTQLLHRMPDGKLRLTPAGEKAVAHAERMEREIGLISSDLAGADAAVAGTVRLTSVPILTNRLLVPSVLPLLRDHPSLRVELIADSRDLSLTRREADMALRLARPKLGGTRVVARRLSSLKYAPYASVTVPAPDVRTLPWISYDESMAHLPQARWMAKASRDGNDEIARVCVNDTEAAYEAVIAGCGRSMLPSIIADKDSRLQRIIDEELPALPERELWLLIHADLAPLARIRMVVDWLEEQLL